MLISQKWTLAVAVLGSSIVFLDSTIVGIALPQIGQGLPRLLLGVLEGQSYVYNGYLLTLSALLILAGALTDFAGRRRMFAYGLIGFGFSSVLCGVAPNVELLVLFRIVQGAAGALLVPGSLALITATFEGEQRGRAFGIWAGASAAATILGPLVGGLLVDTLSWRAAFLVNLPLVAVAVWATLRHVSESRDAQASGAFDWLGAAVVALAVGGLSFGAIYGQQRDWRDPFAFVALGVGVIATVAFPVLMARSPCPLVPLDLFRSRNFTVTNISTLLIYGALYVCLYYLTLFFQGTLGYTASAAGVATIPCTLFLALFAPRFGALAARYGNRWFMTAGPAVMAIGVLLLALVPSTSATWSLRPDDRTSYLPPIDYVVQVLPGLVIFGLGLMVMVAPLTTALMTSVPVQRSGVASAINNAISRVGPQLAGALIFVAITASFYRGMAAQVPGLDVASGNVRATVSPLNRPADGLPQNVVIAARQSSTDAFHLSLVVSAGLLVLGAIVNGVGIRDGLAAPAADAEALAGASPHLSFGCLRPNARRAEGGKPVAP
ncbi:MAG TPA: MFS transporter [Chloroflexota bacterium]